MRPHGRRCIAPLNAGTKTAWSTGPVAVTAFGVLALTFMMTMYAVEHQAPRFAAGCVRCSLYGLCQAPGPLRGRTHLGGHRLSPEGPPRGGKRPAACVVRGAEKVNLMPTGARSLQVSERRLVVTAGRSAGGRSPHPGAGEGFSHPAVDALGGRL